MKIYLLLFLVFFCGCKKLICECKNEKCGIDCKNQCDGVRCIPGEPCCEKCICRNLPK